MFKGNIAGKRIEVLAPAGSYDSLKAAVAAGADAVYAGGPRFGARAFAQNFTEKELQEGIDYAHLHGCRFYLTINTLFKEEELRELPLFLKPLYECGLDAVIVQDIGVFKVVRDYFPELDIHASTQMTITGVYGASFIKQAGAVRVVPARELSLAEIRHLKEQAGMEVECFVHGALCYCYSGQCLMSSMIGGRSGNRGQCAQPCRLSYQAGQKSGYLLSMKDICTLEMIPELVEAGIDSFKIEGRMKRPEYVAGVTSAYRKYTDLYLQHGKKGFYVEEEDKRRLLDLYNRGGFHCGYYTRRNGKEMISVKHPGHAGVAAVKVLSQKGRELTGIALTDLFAGDVLEFPEEQYLRQRMGKGQRNASKSQVKGRGDAFWQQGVGQENNVGGQRPWNYTLGISSPKGSQVSLLAPKNQKIAAGRVIYRTRNQQLLDELGKTYVFGKKQEKVYGFLKLSAGKPATLEVTCGEVSVKVQTSLNVEAAIGRPLTKEQVCGQIYKTNDTEFLFEKLDVMLEGELFLPMQQFNELRRNALQMLQKQICAAYHRKADGLPRFDEEQDGVKESTSRCAPKLSVLVETLEQLKVVLKSTLVERIYLDFDLLETGQERIQEWCDEKDRRTDSQTEQSNGRKSPARCPKLYVAMPYIVRPQTVRRLENLYDLLLDESVDGVLLRNYESVEFFKKRGFPKHLVLDYPLYVMNGQSVSFWKEQGIERFTLSPELNHRELTAFRSDNCELIVYGHYPVMVSAQCIQKTTDQCKHAGGHVHLIDRYKEKFPVRLCCSDCYNIIYNMKPLYLYDLSEDLGKIAPEWIRFQFTVEDGERTADVLGQYERMRDGAAEESAYEYTRGHFYRKVI